MIWRPFTPPAASSALKKACAPYIGPEKVSGPRRESTESIIPILIEVAVTPTSPAAPETGAGASGTGDENAESGNRVPHAAHVSRAAAVAQVPSRRTGPPLGRRLVPPTVRA
ncbi:hypothetical protein GCM10009838_12670 [Catenulispora subtropica]|uniref:Uncharacterized protein n=1 Tax=Catenulispora subtropica TaxID=450798 RepID=A0ABP5C655_9ACTN